MYENTKETRFALYIKDMRRLCAIPPEDRKKAYREACAELGIPDEFDIAGYTQSELTMQFDK